VSVPARGEATEVMAGATRAVFLSYRREETRHIAGRLADRLAERLGPEQVFMDVDTIEPGADFAAVIAREVVSCRILIALIGPTWLTSTGRWRRRRLDDPDDFVVLEIRAALERGIPVIPVLVDGAVMPDRSDLPEGLQRLARRNAVLLDHATFRSDLTNLLNAVDRILSTPAQQAIEPTVDADADVADRAIPTPQGPPQRTAESDRPGVLPAGKRKVVGAHHPSLSTAARTQFSSTRWSRPRPWILLPAAIVIGLSMAGGILLLATNNSLPNNSLPTVTATVPVGDNPRDVAVAPDGHAYITHPNSDSVSVLDTGSNKVTATVPVGDNPRDVAVAPDGHAYITNNYSDSVSVLDTGSNTVIATVPVGHFPEGVAVAPDGRHAYITHYDPYSSDSVSVLDTGSNTVTATVPVGGDYSVGVAVAPDGRHAYITHADSDSVSVVDTGSNRVTATIRVGDYPVGVAVAPDGHHAYITHAGSDSVSVVDTGSNRVTATIRVGDYPVGVAVAPDGHHAYITHTDSESDSVSVVDTGSNRVTATIRVGDGSESVAVAPDGRHAYVPNPNSDSVSVIDTGVG
jgi:YVTN family beta-propeller protein